MHADLVSPAGDVGLWIQGGSDGLAVAVLGTVGSLQAGRGVADVGGRPEVRGQAQLWSLLCELHAGQVQVLGHCLA